MLGDETRPDPHPRRLPHSNIKTGNKSAEKDIMKSKLAGEIKRIGERIEWEMDKYGEWRLFAGQCLRDANEAKFKQNPDLRQKLFDTVPKLLVEANPVDLYWGVGLKLDDPDIYDETKWRGENQFGTLLTKLRDDLIEQYTEKSNLSDQSESGMDDDKTKEGRELSPGSDQPNRKKSRKK